MTATPPSRALDLHDQHVAFSRGKLAHNRRAIEHTQRQLHNRRSRRRANSFNRAIRNDWR